MLYMRFLTGMLAQEQPFPDGTYTITNNQSKSTVRVGLAGGSLYLSSQGDSRGAFEQWYLQQAEEGGYYIQNVGMINSAAYPFVRVKPEQGEICTIDNVRTIFEILPVGDDTYKIRIENIVDPTDNFLWTAEHDQRDVIKVRAAANGFVQPQQKFTFKSVQSQ